MLVTIPSISELPSAAKSILSFSDSNKIFLFYGDMGAGKTTLIKAICEQLGVTDVVTSPTFSIVNEYAGAEKKVYHFDFYRLKNQAEALDLGYEEYFYSDAWCFIEWPEKIPDLLPENFVCISIHIMPDNSRQITIDRN
ncbi:MAG: tRNA ((37)-N6)-threonylcarbamoyltransferase complex ATPase subunit type 1 TsaE [Mucilaginibacter sp.]|nr:tRNA ((37)-N6)-threonylcarbamoyltransferase complex ATPase subunit type 1 TsaE [Mucilaginibacter sp.]